MSVLQKAGLKQKTSPEGAGGEPSSIESQIDLGLVLLELCLNPEMPTVAGPVTGNHIGMFVERLKIQKMDLWVRYSPVSHLM